jgi:hypothetical protein
LKDSLGLTEVFQNCLLKVKALFLIILILTLFTKEFSENKTIWEFPESILSVRDDKRVADSPDMRYRENSRLTLCYGGRPVSLHHPRYTYERACQKKSAV